MKTPQMAQMDILGMQILNLTVNELAQNLHEPLHLERWSIPVFGRKGVQGQYLYPNASTFCYNWADILCSGTMTSEAR
jgi:hypothetical protein